MSLTIKKRPQIKSLCGSCRVTEKDTKDSVFNVILSPTGKAHFGRLETGTTECGKDATSERWWWPL